MKKLSKARSLLLLELESIIGNECYNANIQNWGPNGVFEGEGREFRYPITFIDSDGKKDKRKYPDVTHSCGNGDHRLLRVRRKSAPDNSRFGSGC
jgi:hypothetical protein